MNENCANQNCAYYKNDIFHLYRSKFLWTIIIASIIAIGSFIFLILHFNKDNHEIVSSHQLAINAVNDLLKPATMSKDSCYYVNEQLALSMENYMQTSQSLLELQSSRIQSEHTILSLWAGILMIVFLVFSIYSVFKTDELLRQGRDGLKLIENYEDKAKEIVNNVDQKVNEEMSKINERTQNVSKELQEKAEMAISDIKKEMSEITSDFNQTVSKKTDEFESKYDEILSKIETANDGNNQLINQLINIVKSSMQEEKSKDQKQ